MQAAKAPNLINGFKLIEQKPSPETGSTAYVYLHQATQAKLVYLANDEKNKTFGVGFRTPPEDSTGVAHILEHSVLSGSDKFRTKEPFMDLVQSSLQTFLNAMTFADMTLYPVSSKNDQDFFNLVHVYLDAVFRPLVHERPMIFKQEGWNLELADQDSPLQYNGVVYNEMRGAYSSPDTYNQRQLIKHLYPGSTYAHESGGDPWEIPKLKYEDFLNFHKRLYHPSNSLFFLYGDCDLDQLTQLIDRDYLQAYEAIDPASQIELGQPLSSKQSLSFTYNAEAGQKPDQDSYLSYAMPVGQATDYKSRFILGLVNRILLDGEDAPLRRAIIEAGIGEDIDILSPDIFYLTFGLTVKKADAKKLDQLVTLVEKVLQDQVKYGLDRDLVLASLNKEEMDLRELGGPMRGVILFILTMYAQRYDLDPLAFLSYDHLLQEVRQGIDQGLLENFIQTRILDNPARLTAVHTPEEGLYASFDQAQAQALAEQKAQLSPAEIESLIADTQALRAYQQAPSSPEEQATIPSLHLADLKPQPTEVEEVVETQGPVTFYLHPAKASGLCYNNLYFPLHNLDLDELDDLAFLVKLLGLLAAGDYSFGKLDTELTKFTNGLNFSVNFSQNPQGQIESYLNLAFMTIGNRNDQVLPLVKSVLLDTDFSDHKRIREVLLQVKLQLEESFNFSSHMVGLARAMSHVSAVAKLKDRQQGLGFYFNLSRILADSEAFAQLVQRLPGLADKVCQKSCLSIAITSDPDQISDLKASYSSFLDSLPARDLTPVQLQFELKPQREAFTTATGINYVQVAQDYKALGFNYHPCLAVLSNILGLSYLHNQVRAQGGAYGVGNVVRDDGLIGFFSYRDPQLKRTYDTYHTIPQIIADLNLSDQDLEKAIIGSINTFDPVITPAMINSLMFNRHIKGQDYNYNVRMLADLIATDLDQLKAQLDLYSQALKQESLVVIGDEQAINEQKDLFDHIRPLKQ